MLKLGRDTKVKDWRSFWCWYSFLILAYSNVFEISAAILEKGLLGKARKGMTARKQIKVARWKKEASKQKRQQLQMN